MNDCKVIEIGTPQKYVLNGLWFGPQQPKKVIIFVHGLSSSAFGNHELVTPLVDSEMAVITFNNRGHDKISRIKRLDKRKKKGYTRLLAGEAHEVFTDCVDDIQGVVDFAKKKGIQEIVLMGHSTGCQKSVFYLSKRGNQKQVSSVVLLAPMSDYAGEPQKDPNGVFTRARVVAKQLVREGKEHDLLPLDIWPALHDAQRFLSLYCPDSKEEIFCYCQKRKVPKTYRSIHIPQLVILGEKDEFRDRKITKIGEWFQKNMQSKKGKIGIVENAPHNFFQHEKEVIDRIKNFIAS